MNCEKVSNCQECNFTKLIYLISRVFCLKFLKFLTRVYFQIIFLGEEVWLCYICLKNQAIIEDEQDQLVDTNEEQDQDEQPPDELINEITNQNVVQAHHYVKAMKKLQNFDFDFTEKNSKNSSIFDRDDFQLNLSRKPEDQG